MTTRNRAPERTEQDLLIGELAERSGLPAKTIRFYEEIGLLPRARRAENGYRLYNADDVRRLHFIRGARQLDWSLDQLKQVLALRDQGEAPCHHVLAQLKAQVVEIEERIRRLRELEENLQDLLALAETLPNDDIEMKHCVCGLLARATF